MDEIGAPQSFSQAGIEQAMHSGRRVACPLAGNLKFVEGRKSVIFGVWSAPGAPETVPKGGGLRPPPFVRVSGALGKQAPPLVPIVP
jgi:hypothetical protein